MEVIDYAYPESWDDKGMDWNAPDSGRADYSMAIRLALMERAAAAHGPLPPDVFGISPYKTLSLEAVRAVADAIADLAPRFVNAGFTDYKPDYSDFPKMWTYRELVMEEGCDFFRYCPPGGLLADGAEWFKRLRNALNKLHAVPCEEVRGMVSSCSAGIHNPPFGESISRALSEALKSLNDSALRNLPTNLYAWSGNTHWVHDEENGDGYCGYAQSRALRIRAVLKYLPTAECDLVLHAVLRKPEGPVSYSQVLATSIFDSGGTGLKEGLNTQTTHVTDPENLDIAIGDARDIPKNSTVPHSDFNEDSTLRRSAKRGYEGRVVGILDYAAENGFQFQ